jgi:tripartite-type tricarboxylate transporter receptor subunit TctC
MAESGLVAYEISAPQAEFAPAATPAPIVERRYTEIAPIRGTREIQKRFTDLGLDRSGMSPQELAVLIKADVPRRGKIVKESGARAD